ncbi:MAG: TlpA disulfide reductase family protein [Bacteroidales bacterium]|jgi:thiol-disulfide isomerase/thioredoxin|nr:TlpA disulfide reductase family protein [Bacteroidales bacterium]
MKKLTTLFVLLFIAAFAYSQNTITSSFPGLANQQIKLVGFQGFNTYTIDSVQANTKGEFSLKFNKNDSGMAYLMAEDKKSFIVVLAENENLQLKGETLALTSTVEIIEGRQNQLFEKYASEHPRREQTRSAWDYLARIYTQDSLFAVHKQPKQAIENEKKRIKAEDSLFLENINKDSYISWYLPVRKLVSSVSTVVQYRPDEIASTLKTFRELDYTDNRLYKSGLLKETIESHFWLIENSGHSLESAYVEMNKSIDYMIENLITDEGKLNELSGFLFKLLEKRSLFTASEYLALKVLNEVSCTIDSDLASQMESYRAMKIGNITPDFEFKGDVFTPAYAAAEAPKKLSEIDTDYTVLVFGSSWCPACPQELMQIVGLYQKWKKHSLEVVFVSLDEEAALFKQFSKPFPFISLCDYQKWESPVVEAYHVFATPTIFLLNSQREIILRPNSVKQLAAWVDWNLAQDAE